MGVVDDPDNEEGDSEERCVAVRRAREALDELKQASLPSSECSVREAERRAAAARHAVAVVGRLERHRNCSTSGGGGSGGRRGSDGERDKDGDHVDVRDEKAFDTHESLREELRSESVRAVGAAVERERSALFAPAPGTDSGGGNAVDTATRDAESTAAEVTAGLRRARGVLMAEVDRTDAAMGVMNDSIKSLGAINAEFDGSMKSGLKDSQGLLKTLERQEQMEKYVMWVTFAIFMLAVCFVCYRRLPFLQVHRLVELGSSIANKATGLIGGGGVTIGGDDVGETLAAASAAAQEELIIDDGLDATVDSDFIADTTLGGMDDIGSFDVGDTEL